MAFNNNNNTQGVLKKTPLNWLLRMTPKVGVALCVHPLRINDLSFMDDVKNNKCIVKQYPRSNLKKKIQEYIEHELNIDNKDNPNEYLKSDRYIIKCFTYKNLGTNLEKLPADVTLNIIDKAYDSYLSFYALKQKGIGCSKPDFLPKESKYNLFYTASSRKQITINKIEYMRITLGEYVSKNYVEISKSEMLFMDFKSKKLKYSKYINEFGNNCLRCFVTVKRLA